MVRYISRRVVLGLVLSVLAASFYLVSVGLRDVAHPQYRAESRQ